MRALLIAAALALVLAPLAAADGADDPDQGPPAAPCRPMCIAIHLPSVDPDDPTQNPCRPTCL